MSEHRASGSASGAPPQGVTRGFRQQTEAASPALPQPAAIPAALLPWPAALPAALEPLAAQEARD
eukprot:306607-Heterocapsa_arctica.AAC.1